MKKPLKFRTFSDNVSANDILYHGTSDTNAAQILRSGLDPSKSLFNGKIHLTTNYTEASKYAKIANGGKIGTIFSVPRKVLDTKYITHDKDGIIHYTAPIPKDHVMKFL